METLADLVDWAHKHQEEVEEKKPLNTMKYNTSRANKLAYDPENYTVMDWISWRALVHLRILYS